MRRATVLVSGAPGAGKTTLAEPLAAELGFALLSKDHIKETLHDALSDPVGDLPWSRRIGGVSMELLWALAPRCPQVVLEANFRPHSAICAQRYALRAPQAHPAHVVTRLSPELQAEFDRPVGLGKVVIVDTTRPADVRALAATVRHLLGTPAASTDPNPAHET